MTDVLFGQAYFLRFDPKLWEAQQPYARRSACTAAVARKRECVVSLFDAMLAASKPVGHRARRPPTAVRGDHEDGFNC